MLIFQSTCPARGTTPYVGEELFPNQKFQSTCPARGTTCESNHGASGKAYFNPRAPRGARPRYSERWSLASGISIHVPREGHDPLFKGDLICGTISIHVPREGHDDAERAKVFGNRSFQSTCPARGTTLVLSVSLLLDVHFNPRAPRGARRLIGEHRNKELIISIHVPREGHDSFYWPVFAHLSISIHVPREGHDFMSTLTT